MPVHNAVRPLFSMITGRPAIDCGTVTPPVFGCCQRQNPLGPTFPPINSSWSLTAAGLTACPSSFFGGSTAGNGTYECNIFEFFQGVCRWRSTTTTITLGALTYQKYGAVYLFGNVGSYKLSFRIIADSTSFPQQVSLGDTDDFPVTTPCLNSHSRAPIACDILSNLRLAGGGTLAAVNSFPAGLTDDGGI